jgi:alanyl-tRNA synthetase
MPTITGRELRTKFLEFMKSKGHSILPSASLVPKEDPTVLFNTAGMQPLVPYLMGLGDHPNGNRLANSQKCLRTNDIEEAGDNRHLTFFEMLGNWSIGDYFKNDSIAWSWEFLTDPRWLGLDKNRIYVTTYIGGGDAPEDTEAEMAWKTVLKQDDIEAESGVEYDFKNPASNPPDRKYRYRITKMGTDDNWWGLSHRGPCGGDTEIFYLLDKWPANYIETEVCKMNPEQAYDFLENNLVEIWNNVFMEYEGETEDINGKATPVRLTPLKSKNVDTGMGLERIVMMLNGYSDVYQTDLLQPIVQVINKWENTKT